MNIESTLSIIASALAIGGAVWGGYKWVKQTPLTALMTELADKNTSVKRQHRILAAINKRLMLLSHHISTAYINDFHSNGRSKLAIFYDICNENNIEPTTEICKLLLGYDEQKFRNEWTARHLKTESLEDDIHFSKELASSESSLNAENKTGTVYLSAILAERHPETCKRLTGILNKHNIPFIFLKGTKDIWCRDYMPIQTPGDNLIQFKYDPSYLRDSKYSDTRSDVRYVDRVNNLNPFFSDINLDGGNVVMYGNKAIISDRVFSENPDWTRKNLHAELSRLLECEIIIIPAYKPEYDFTGHADGMIRFIDSNTVLVNNLDQDFKYMKDAIIKVLGKANLKFINFPWFKHKIKGNNEHAIGIYLNYLEVGNLIIMPIFGVAGNKDKEALAKLKEVFPHKVIEAIDYNDIALNGGALNCTTWVMRQETVTNYS